MMLNKSLKQNVEVEKKDKKFNNIVGKQFSSQVNKDSQDLFLDNHLKDKAKA